MFDLPIIDAYLLKLFRFRTRAFMRMVDAPGTVPTAPPGGSGYLYVHIPFCEVLCPFCSFHRVQHRHSQAVLYFAALRDEIRLYHAAGHRFTGVYFGGGTPTTEPAELVTTIALVRELFGVKEISVETNPKDLRPEIMEPLRAAGVTRLSVGVQSFDDQLLREMERYEKYGSGAEAMERIRSVAGMFPTLNVDFIFNQPHQTLASLERDLALFRDLGANQVSFYPLMTSPTVHRRMVGAMGLPDQRRLRQFYHTIVQRLGSDFAPSSAWCFTRRGHGTDEYIVAADNYVGVGSGAFSYLEGTLYCTTFSLAGYEQRIAQGLTGITTCHRLRETDRLRYTLLVRMFGLHLDREAVLRQHGPRFFRQLWGELLTLRVLGAAHRDARGWHLNERGMFWLTLMMSAFFESVNNYRDAMRAHVNQELQESTTMCVPVGSLAGGAVIAK
ncbi:MAG: coproporphyrinogen III oxidase family protein [Candidatus Didemnitutus sp.]|nr:coproporphyrinogen III oxidase family protein [Candidatus Didemnitutus sp.]